MVNTLLPSGTTEKNQIKFKDWLDFIMPVTEDISLQAKYYPNHQGMRSEKIVSLAIPARWKDHPKVLVAAENHFNTYVAEVTGKKVKLDMTKTPDDKNSGYLIWTGKIGAQPTPRVTVEDAEDEYYGGFRPNLFEAVDIVKAIIQEGIEEGTSEQTKALIDALETISEKLDDPDSRIPNEQLTKTLDRLTDTLETISDHRNEDEILEAIHNLQEQLRQSEYPSESSRLQAYIDLSHLISRTPIVSKDAPIIYDQAFDTIIEILKENELYSLAISIRVLAEHIQDFQKNPNPQKAKELHKNLTTIEEDLSIYNDTTSPPTWQTSPNIRLWEIFSTIKNKMAININ